MSWDPTCRAYSTEELRDIFRGFGAAVEDVVLRDRKKKRKATALVVMATETAAASAVGSVCGGPSEPLLVVPLVGNMAGGPLPDSSTAAESAVDAENDGMLPREGGDGTTTSAAATAANASAVESGLQSVLQRPACLLDPPSGRGGRPLFSSVVVGTAAAPGDGAAKSAFPVPPSSMGCGVGGGGLFPSAAGATVAAAAASGRAFASFSSAAAQGQAAPAFGSWRAAAGGPTGGDATGGGGSYEDEVLEKMRRASAARQGVAAGKEASG